MVSKKSIAFRQHYYLKNGLMAAALLLVVMAARAQQKDFEKLMNASFNLAAQQYLQLHKTVPANLFPRSINPDGTLMTNDSHWWTSGFFPGSLWYLYEQTGNKALKEAAWTRTKSLEKEQFNDGDHDIGFKMMCSYGNALRITKDSSVIQVLVTAANSLTKRFNPTVGSIHSWGAKDDSTNFLVIIDNMMNLELLFAATRFTGDSSFYKIALAHADKTAAEHYRTDGSSYHVVEYNPTTGAVTKKRTAQGFADSSAWARGQSWGLYGFVATYRATGQQRYLQMANKIAHFLLQHPHLPKDKIPYWDYDAPNIPVALRDASAAAIMASALLELSTYVQGDDKNNYVTTATTIIRHLSAAPYRAALGEAQHFLLKHSVGHLPAKSEVDVPLSYADYYYLEAMSRYKALLARKQYNGLYANQ